jgi:hypothetical protein
LKNSFDTKLSELPNITMVKEATGSLDEVQEVIRLCGDSFEIYSGDDGHVFRDSNEPLVNPGKPSPRSGKLKGLAFNRDGTKLAAFSDFAPGPPGTRGPPSERWPRATVWDIKSGRLTLIRHMPRVDEDIVAVGFLSSADQLVTVSQGFAGGHIRTLGLDGKQLQGIRLPASLPVKYAAVDSDGKVVGLISIGDIVKRRVQEYETEQEALRDYIKTA